MLGKWSAEETMLVQLSIERAKAGVLLWVFQGLARAMNTVNAMPAPGTENGMD